MTAPAFTDTQSHTFQEVQPSHLMQQYLLIRNSLKQDIEDSDTFIKIASVALFVMDTTNLFTDPTNTVL